MGGTSRVSSYEEAQQALSRTRSSAEAFVYSESATKSGRGAVHERLNPRGVVRECRDTPAMPRVTPIVFGMDVTRSRGKDARIVYEQTMPLLGALFMANAVEYPQLLFAAIGDATADRAPIQVGQFESDDRMDRDLERLWLEEGGGGSGEESYELFAYFLSRKTAVDAIDVRGQKGFCFITGDEAPYPFVKRDEVNRIFGDTLPADIPTPDMFAELQKRYRTYLLYPGKPFADREADIDAEIRQRLLKAGGRFEHCSIRASLIWNTFDDLDLHVVTPSGEDIFYGNKVGKCGGELDVDRNAGGPQTREPVENTRWARGTARPGKYVVFVRNYAHHEQKRADIPFKVELEVDGDVKSFNGVMKKDVTGPQSDITAFEFTYEPNGASKPNAEAREKYRDEVILHKWEQCIPAGHIIRLRDAKSTTEAAIAIMAMQSGKKSLAKVIEDMRERAVSDECIADIEQALKPFASQAVIDEVDEGAFA